MVPIKISQLPQFFGDSSGSYVVINDSNNAVTYTVKKEDFLSGSFYGTASYALTASYVDASNVVGLNLSKISSGSATASISPGIFNVNTNTYVQGDITASNALFTDTITARTLVVQYITASTELVTGSTKFGTQLTDTHQFTGSVSITGSLILDGPLYATSSWANNAVTASFITASNLFGPFGSNSVISASYSVSASYALSSSFASSASYVDQNVSLDTLAPSSKLGRSNNSFFFKLKNDVVGQGQITLTNASSNIVGVGTNFLDSSFIGLSYWFALEVVDSAGNFYRIQTNAPSTNTAVVMNEVFSRSDIESGYYTLTARGSTWPGVSGTYSYWIVRNTSDGPYSIAAGNRSYASDFSTAFGGSTVAINGGTALGFGTNAMGNGNLSMGMYSIATASNALSLANTSMGYHSLANGVGSLAGGGFFGTSYTLRARFAGANIRRLTSSGTGSFNFSGNNNSQTLNHGALSDFSAILGGINHNIPTSSLRSAIIGGNAIKADENRSDTVYVPNLQVTGSAAIRGNVSITGSLFATSSWSSNTVTALTASTADSLFARQNITASNARFTTLFITSSSPSTSALTITGSVLMTGSITISNMLVLVSQSLLPATAPTGAIMTSGSGVDNKPYYWNGATWRAFF